MSKIKWNSGIKLEKKTLYIKAKKNDIISRAYYKLEEIDKKHNLFKYDKNILDVGCSPGGWTQYILKKNSESKNIRDGRK